MAAFIMFRMRWGILCINGKDIVCRLILVYIHIHFTNQLHLWEKLL